MRLAVRAWLLRETARRALAGCDFELAITLAEEAQQAQWTKAGASLFLLGRGLITRADAGPA